MVRRYAGSLSPDITHRSIFSTHVFFSVLLHWSSPRVSHIYHERGNKTAQLGYADWKDLHREAEVQGRTDLRVEIRWVQLPDNRFFPRISKAMCYQMHLKLCVSRTLGLWFSVSISDFVDKPLDWKTIDLKKMRVKELKNILGEWGEACKGCTEKTDFIKRIEELKPKYVKDELWSNQISIF